MTQVIKILCFLSTEFEKAYFIKVDKLLAMEGITVESQFLSFSKVDEIDESLNNSKNVIFISVNHPFLNLPVASDPSILYKKFSKTNVVLLTDIKSIQKASELCLNNKLIKFVMNTEMPPEINLPVLRVLLVSQKISESKNSLNEMAKKLNKYLSENLNQIEKIKKIHRQLVKFRSENIRPFEIHGRYAPGSASGGEFYDIIKGEQEIILVMTSSNNYQSSSKVITFIQSLKPTKNLSAQIANDFVILQDFFKKISETDIDFNYLLVKLTLSSAQVVVWAKGNFNIISNKGLNDKNKHSIVCDAYNVDTFNMHLNRGDKIIFQSPGLLKNIGQRMIGNDTIGNFIEKKIDMEMKDLINEVFFQLKNISESKFLEYDATVVTIEIEPNAILKV